MKRLSLMLFLSVNTVFAVPRAYGVVGDPMAQFDFRVTLIPVVGETHDVKADLSFDPENLQEVKGTVSVGLKAIDTGIGLRDEHARNFLGVSDYPRAQFKISRIVGVKKLILGQELRAFAEGFFLLKGVTQSLKAPVNIKFDGKNISVATEFEVTLRDHGIDVPGADATTGVRVQFTLKAK